MFRLSPSSTWRTATSRPFRVSRCQNLQKKVAFHRGCIWRNERTHEQPYYQARRSASLTPLMVLLGITPIVTLALGTWQIQRLQWKVELIDELQEKLQRPPMELPKFVNIEALSDFAFRKVWVKGKWDHEHTVMISPRVRDGTKGVNVITPLIREDGSTILVNRGFVTDEHADLHQWRKKDQATEEVEVFGMLRNSQRRHLFSTVENRPEKDEWYWVDVNALAEHAGGETANVQPVYLEEIFEGHPGEAHMRLTQGMPIGRAPTVEIRNSHAAYVFTWYSLSALTTLMFVHLLRKRAKAPTVRMPRR